MDAQALSSEILREAARRYLRASRDRGESSANLRRWLNADARHRAAYDGVVRAYRYSEVVADDAVIRAVRAEVSALRAARSRRRAAVIAGVAAAVLALIYVTLPMAVRETPSALDPSRATARLVWKPFTSEAHSTAVVLSDGSVLRMAPNTSVRVAYGDRIRALDLQAGNAYFEVAHALARPFTVTAGERVAVAHGTAFGASVSQAAFRISLVEGVIDVDRRSFRTAFGVPLGAEGRRRLSAGQELVGRAGQRASLRPIADLKAVLIRPDVLAFDDTPIGQALIEVNRYSDIKILTTRNDVRGRRVSGVFRAGSQESIANSIAAVAGLSVRRVSPQSLLLVAP